MRKEIVGITCPHCKMFISERFNPPTVDELKYAEVLATLDGLNYEEPLNTFYCSRCKLILEPPVGYRVYVAATKFWR